MGLATNGRQALDSLFTLVRGMFQVAVATAADFFPAFKAVCLEDLPPYQVIAAAERIKLESLDN